MMQDNSNDKLLYGFVIFRGLISIFLLAMFLSLVLAAISYVFPTFVYLFGDLQAAIFSLLILIFLGFFVARRVESNGWLNGGIAGVVYMGLILLYFATVEVSLSPIEAISFLCGALLLGALGGIVGINFS